MVGELILLPLRVGVRATRLWLRVAEETAAVAASATGRVIGLAASRGSEGHSTAGWPSQTRDDVAAERPPQSPRGNGSASSQEASVGTIEREAPATRDRWVAPPPPAPPLGARHVPPPEPVHVSDEPELVEEVAEPGAEDGAGAQIRIDEPWDGYGQMNAKQIIARLNAATPAALAAVQLYESSHRRRQTILNAVQRELRSPNGNSSPNQ
ncbi:MAG TPA: hypothetical protein VKR21_00190 [Solirubrobacteraceae bacterium]|nr:hypothetical protein [Solirubrobacteraceae bacterium]